LNRISTNLISIAALVIILAAARSAQEIILPFLLAIFISIIAEAPVDWMREKRIPAGLAVTITVIAIICFLLGTSIILTTSIDSFSQSLPSYLERLRESTQGLVHWLGGVGIDVPEASFGNILDAGAAMRFANSLLGSLAKILSNTFLIVMTVIFMLLEVSSFSAKIELIQNDAGKTLARISHFLDDTKRYMSIKAATSLVTGILIGIGMFVLGVDYPILWGFLAFLLNFIPTIGSIIAAVPAVLLAVVQLGFSSAFAVAGVFLAVNLLIGNAVEPRVMGRGVGLSTLVVFLSLVFWGWLFGPIGMLLSIPLTMLVKFGAEANEDTHWIATMLSSVPPPVPAASDDAAS